jgi:hypothetical protein
VQRINVYVILLTFKVLSGKAPAYIKDMLVLYQGRSSTKTLLAVPKSRWKTAGDIPFE